MNHAIIHIGPNKSGTSALARYLTVAQSRDELPKDVVYPIGELWFGRMRNIVKQETEILKIGASSRDDLADKGLSGIFADLDAAIAKVGAATRAGGPSTAVFVCESAGRNTTGAALRSWFAPYFDKVTFVTLARRQDRAMASMMAQRIKAWEHPQTSLNLHDYLVQEVPFQRSIDYASRLGEWSLPSAPLRVIPYLENEEDSMKSIRRFFSALDLGKPVEVRGIENKRIHPTFSYEGLAALAERKRRVQRWGWVPGYAKAAEAGFHEEWKKYHTAAALGGIDPSGRRFVPFSLSDADARLVLERFADSNADFLARVDRTGLEPEWAEWEKSLVAARG